MRLVHHVGDRLCIAVVDHLWHLWLTEEDGRPLVKLSCPLLPPRSGDEFSRAAVLQPQRSVDAEEGTTR
jgi:hypothetical protein